MHNCFVTRLVAIGAFAMLCAGTAQAAEKAVGKLNTADFVAACSSDENVTDEPGFEDGKVTPKAFCDCVAGELEKAQLSQKDVDMLVKMHKDEIGDADAEAYPNLEDLMTANEGYEDSCRKTLGLPAETDEETPMEEDEVPDEGTAPDDNSPPE